ncbi:MAG: nucleotide sugar dehydratase [Rhodospirillales bacterium 70-18]|nr:polysaccharide biosynthesis protein [Rhodospirillales bacterium]OJY70367.1 MAG: nucleotide sugar dehydratase [Rhodospirillales bacterium 70-18]
MSHRRAMLRIGMNAGLDFLLAAAAVPLARWLSDPAGDPMGPAWAIAWGGLALLIAGVPFRLSFQYWRFAGVNDMLGVTASSIAAAALYAVALHAAGTPLPSPTFPIVHVLCLAMLLALPRGGYRLMQEGTPPAEAGTPALLVGAGEGADLFLRALAGDHAASLRVVGLLSTGQAQTGRRIQGHAILGPLAEAAAVLARLRAAGTPPQVLVVTDPELSGQKLSALIETAEREGVRIARAPRPTALEHDAAAGPVQLKPVAIEDLLNRAQVPLDREGMARLVHGRRVLVTGAGGTIGAELARQVAALGPARLVLLDNGEYALWQIDLELGELAPAVPRRAVIADIRDETRIRAVIEACRPELVFHAAALKHVPMVEANPLEGLLTNVAGTRHVADAARAAGALAMVLISTDKAVNPTSVMGASKRLAEMYCQGLDLAALAAGASGGVSSGASGGASGGMRCITVRFGNVLGSTGSVVPLFQRQLAHGGPLTVTHPDMQRYFMTVREAVGLVLQASVVGVAQGAECALASHGPGPGPGPGKVVRGGVFVLDMGEPVKIVELARTMIRLAGLRPEVDVPIRFTGLRPGEKLFEELFHGQEPPVATGYPGLLMAVPRTADPAIVARAIDELAAACRTGHASAALAVLARMLPEFAHNSDGSAGAARA